MNNQTDRQTDGQTDFLRWTNNQNDGQIDGQTEFANFNIDCGLENNCLPKLQILESCIENAFMKKISYLFT